MDVIITLMGPNAKGRMWANVDVGDSRLHILNERALEHYMKHQLKLTKEQRVQAFRCLDLDGRVKVQLAATEAAS